METTSTEQTVGGFRLLRYFSIASLIALALAVIGLAFFFREIAVKQVIKFGEDTNANLTKTLANTLMPHYIPLIEAAEMQSTDELKASPTIARFHNAVRGAVRNTQVVKVKIFDSKGRTIYSSEAREIGIERGESPGITAASRGVLLTRLYRGESIEAFGQALRDRDLLGTYLPMMRPSSTRPDAVFEVYSDVTPLLEEIRRTQWNMRFATAAVVILLYGTLFVIVKRADDVIKRQAKQREQDAQTIQHLAHHDSLTGLPNRKLFTDRLSMTLARARRSKRIAALLFIDFDRFKEVNDALGHAAGDRVLQEAGRRLKSLLRDADTVARLGGDEFTIVLEDVADAAHAAGVAQKIREAFAAAMAAGDDVDIVMTPSIGIALYPADGNTIDALLKAADAAMYDAKSAGRNAYRFYRPAAAAPAAS